jgi:transglutaminase-like putative cysteine protease
MIEVVRSANRTRRPEDSVALRASVLGAVMTGVVALAAEQAISVSIAGAVLVVLPFAYWVSYVRRTKDNWAIKIAVIVGAVLAMIRFLGQVKGVTSLDQVRFPLADIFLLIQVLHSFDLPQRKDLSFSLGSSLALMAVAGSLSQDLGYALFLVIYFVFVVAALTLGYRSEIADGTQGWMRPRSPRGRARRPAREIVQAAAATALAGAILFLVLPQPSGVKSFALPFNIGSGLGTFAGDGIANPGFEEGPPGTRSSAANYYAFGDRMDLSVRGELSDELVMRVRSSAPAMWRGGVFDRYDGTGWSGATAEPTPLGEGSPPYLYPPEFRSLGPREEVTETFYIEREQPSLIFSGGQPDEVYYEGGVSIDALGALRTSSTLTEGTVYSVISSRGAASAAELRAQSASEVPDELERYLKLPALPQRVEDLARRITSSTTNEYDAVKAVERYLRENYRYALDSPIPPSGRDAVDYFLFDDNVGFCEQFASATAVMLRSLGYPARVVVGYTTGSRNAFTGYYEVHGTDAHSWVEVWFPTLGWYEFDPTFAVPPARGDIAELVPLVRALRFLAEKAQALFSGGAAGAGRSVLILLLVVLLAAGTVVAVRKRRPSGDVRAPTAPFTGGAVAMAFHRFEQALRAAGRARFPSETAAELVARTTKSTSEEQSALRVFERERYGHPPPRPAEVAVAAGAFDRMAETIRHETEAREGEGA